MGPSSQGNNIAVERYLGSCLISSASRKPKKPPDECNNIIIKQRQQQQQHYHHHHTQQQQQQQQQRHNNNYVVSSEYSNGWTGMPLISMANSRRSNPGINKKQQQQQQQHHQQQQDIQQQNERSPLSRLAIHTQGAPLILSGNYGRKNGKNNTPAPLRIVLPRHPRSGKEPPSTPSSPPACGSDSLSVASDESSGHSENSLPRIIKPRKRRKKERKPSLSTPENETPSSINNNTSIVTLQPYVPLCYEFDKFRQRNNNNNKGNVKITDKVIGPPSKDNIIRNTVTPPSYINDDNHLKHQENNNNNDVSDIPSIICQCRYCDPAGLIWDFDRRCYSPSLTSPSPISPRLSNLPILRPSSGEYPWYISHESLRRSHSEPSSNNNNVLPLIPVQQQNNIIPIIKDEVPTESSSLSSSYFSKPTQELEVTSEIVTSLNGHRDIEIKFFLSSSSSSSNCETLSPNREE